MLAVGISRLVRAQIDRWQQRGAGLLSTCQRGRAVGLGRLKGGIGSLCRFKQLGQALGMGGNTG
jgi:hypothetical protein